MTRYHTFRPTTHPDRPPDTSFWFSAREACPVCSLAGLKSRLARLEPIEHVYFAGHLYGIRWRYRCQRCGHEFPGATAKRLSRRERE